MVKIEDLPEEQPRVELETLSDFMKANGYEVEFISLGEKEQEATESKTGGINITLWTGVNFISKYDTNAKKIVVKPIEYEDGLRLTQKYSKISGRAMKDAMMKLGLNDTEQLKDAFYFYELKPFRTGFPRLIPVKKSDKKPELPTE